MNEDGGREPPVLQYAPVHQRRPQVVPGTMTVLLGTLLMFFGLIATVCGAAAAVSLFGRGLSSPVIVGGAGLLVFAAFGVFALWIAFAMLLVGVRRMMGLPSVPASWKNRWWMPFNFP